MAGGDNVPVLAILGSVCGLVALYAWACKSAGDARRLSEKVQCLADANYRNHLIATGAATAEFVNSVEAYKIPQEFYAAARAFLTQS